MKKLALLIAALYGVSGVCADGGEDDEIVIETEYADGTTNTWTRSDLADALGLVNRKYHRDMAKSAGRKEWHGDVVRSYVLTNADELVRVDLHDDGFIYTAPAQRRVYPDPEAKKKAKIASLRAELERLERLAAGDLPEAFAETLAARIAAVRRELSELEGI